MKETLFYQLNFSILYKKLSLIPDALTIFYLALTVYQQFLLFFRKLPVFLALEKILNRYVLQSNYIYLQWNFFNELIDVSFYINDFEDVHQIKEDFSLSSISRIFLYVGETWLIYMLLFNHNHKKGISIATHHKI